MTKRKKLAAVKVSMQKLRDARSKVIELAMQNKNAEAYVLYSDTADSLAAEAFGKAVDICNYSVEMVQKKGVITMDLRMEIMKQFLDQIHGLVVVDRESNVVFIDEQYARDMGYEAKKIIGLPVKQIIPTSKLPIVLESGKLILGDVFDYFGRPSICNRWPLIKDGKTIGAVSFSIFEEIKESEKLFESLKELRSKLEYYKEKLKQYSGARYSLADILGSSECTVELRKAILRASCTNSTVFIQGETGQAKNWSPTLCTKKALGMAEHSDMAQVICVSKQVC